jgi:hypothetical protein|nr:MAG TPA: hypothetical protein [Caudoviricetes sp.]DAS86751.1 MAG TPA: hypothetical protein [Caudoviricetes sp.]
MEILRQHENGTILVAIKTYEELTQDEIDSLTLACTDTVEQYKDFKIDRNKHGRVTRAVGHFLSDEYRQYLDNSQDIIVPLKKATKIRKSNPDLAAKIVGSLIGK